jgi:HAT1-interacting factor 1
LISCRLYSKLWPSEKINDNATKATDATADISEMSADTAVEHAKRAFALKKYDQAVEYYARALEVV